MTKQKQAGRQAAAGGRRQLKVRLKTAKQRTASSQRWLERQLNDPYVAAAKREGYRSRSAFKLIEIDDKAPPAQAGQARGRPRRGAGRLGPGGGRAGALGARAKGRGRWSPSTCCRWSRSPASSSCISISWTRPRRRGSQALLRGGRADVVLSDMAAQGTGHTRTDHLRIMGLAEAAIEFACEVLEPGGAFVCKVFQGGTERELLDRLRRAFATVRHVKPPASRAESAELYVVATGFRGGGDAG